MTQALDDRPLYRLLTLVPLLVAALSGCGARDAEPLRAPGAEVAPDRPAAAAVAERPNVLLIVVDDLGFSDLGFFGSEIRTPSIDALAQRGTTLTDFHVKPTCSPTRAALLSGTDHHLAGLGTMGAGVLKEQRGKPGYEGYLNERVVSLATLLRDGGYNTYMAGKWHLGAGPGQTPDARGFQRSFALMGGGASHFSDALGLVVFEMGADYRRDGEPVDELPADFFSSTFYTDQMLSYIDADRDQGRPFFGYLAYTAPHWPLQVPDEYLDRYRGVYDDGYETLLKQRTQALIERGVLPAHTASADFADHVPAWSELSEEEQARSSRVMEIYAAMVEHLDEQIGRLLDELEQRGLADNTLVIFFSDNGPEGNDIGKLPLNSLWLALSFDNSLENIGRRDSYVWTGPGWAHASSGPLQLYKAFPTEGGIRVPAIFNWPANIPPAQSSALSSVTDVTATVLDYAGIEHPGRAYRGHAIEPMQGRSLKPLLEGAVDGVHPADAVHGLELFGRRAMRRGDWKAVWMMPPFGSGEWQLYNLAEDPGETRDLAQQHPAILAELTAAWAIYQREQGVVLPQSGDAGYGTP